MQKTKLSTEKKYLHGTNYNEIKISSKQLRTMDGILYRKKLIKRVNVNNVDLRICGALLAFWKWNPDWKKGTRARA